MGGEGEFVSIKSLEYKRKGNDRGAIPYTSTSSQKSARKKKNLGFYLDEDKISSDNIIDNSV
jgi:hypothetical protein